MRLRVIISIIFEVTISVGITKFLGLSFIHINLTFCNIIVYYHRYKLYKVQYYNIKVSFPLSTK